ncbi:MAG TPA: zinc ribbon domain-containing protein [Phycisphaerae bacterium]|nr:zinc ribbon domain-containing protein [Phycisphaerae bacterium]HNU45153.1 zinc ribbon domain-containing protein [Phycisphaerae bacterium]
MPTYEYQCKKCGKVFELFQGITARPRKWIETDCRQCENRAPVVRLIGIGGGVIFKGSGFYQTDYRSEKYKQAAKAEREASSAPVAGGNGGQSPGSAKPAGDGKSTGSDKSSAPDKAPSAEVKARKPRSGAGTGRAKRATRGD